MGQIHGSAKPGTPEGDEYESLAALIYTATSSKDGTVKWTEPTWISDLKTRFPRLLKGIDEFNFAVGEGWKGIITGLCEQLDALSSHRVVITQIKEKFGSLRVYTTLSSEGVSSLIMMAQEAALGACESCGAPGRNIKFATLCDSCRAKFSEDDDDTEGP